jgi:succinyl-CoA synthetase beta subunit
VAWHDIAASVVAHDLADAFTGCLVQEQVMPGPELLLSIRHDTQFGPLAMVGAGGTLVELLHDVASAPAPLSHEAALRMVSSLRVARMLDAWRGQPARDIAAIVDALVRLSWLAVDLDTRLVDLEINPLIAGSVGAGVRAVDLRVEWAGGTMTRFGMIGIVLAALAQFSTPQALAQGNCTPKLGHPPLARKGM